MCRAYRKTSSPMEDHGRLEWGLADRTRLKLTCRWQLCTRALAVPTFTTLCRVLKRVLSFHEDICTHNKIPHIYRWIFTCTPLRVRVQVLDTQPKDCLKPWLKPSTVSTLGIGCDSVCQSEHHPEGSSRLQPWHGWDYGWKKSHGVGISKGGVPARHAVGAWCHSL